MRLQLSLTVILLAASTAHADGVVEARTVYYKETATRVVQPMLDGMFDAGARGIVDAHLLVDAVSSASPGAGAGKAVEALMARREQAAASGVAVASE